MVQICMHADMLSLSAVHVVSILYDYGPDSNLIASMSSS